MYYVLTTTAVLRSASLKMLNKKHNTAFERNEFRRIGNDYFIRVTNDDFEFQQDKSRLAKIPMQNLYRRDTTRLMLTGTLFLQALVLLSSCQGG